METVVLNADYSYLNIVPWQRAIKLIVKKKVEVLKETEKIVRNCTNTYTFKVPLVLRLVEMVKTVYKNKVPFSRKNIFVRDNFECQYCGSSKRLSLDHVVPTSRGGKTNFMNCVTSCVACNLKKGNKSIEEAHMKLFKQPHEPTIMEVIKLKVKNTSIGKFLKETGLYEG